MIAFLTTDPAVASELLQAGTTVPAWPAWVYVGMAYTFSYLCLSGYALSLWLRQPRGGDR